MAEWSKSRVMRECERINARNDRNQDAVRRIRESDHPLADGIAEALDEQCVILADACSVVEDIIGEG